MTVEEKIKELFSYDPKSGQVVRKVTTSSRAKAGDIVGYDSHGYLQVSVAGTNYPLHRIAWLLMTGCWPKYQVDHVNRCRADNTWKNLREATSQENARNRGIQENNTSGFVGVSFNKRLQKWEAYSKTKGKKSHLGFYSTDVEASEAYKTYARIVFGNFYAKMEE